MAASGGVYEIIRLKRDSGELSRGQIDRLIGGLCDGSIPDYQIAAWLMAVYLRGMSARETADLTDAMVHSGTVVDLSALEGIPVDKHSTGGVGDKTTLVLAPMLAAIGLKVAKMSGRGLGHTGGTLDKLESIPGFSVDLGPERLVQQASAIGLAVAGQTAELVPADGALYALRDVTATVESLPLIASSIMSKKIASGARALVLDVKTGSGAFMQRPDDAFALARAMVDIGARAGRRVVAVITSMEQPLGWAVGNALEVREAIDTLRGGGPADLRELCLVLGAQLVAVALPDRDAERARVELERLLDDGSALDRFRALVVAQGGDAAVIADAEAILPRARYRKDLAVREGGHVASIDALTIGEAARDLGAGRQIKGEAIAMAAGIVLATRVGEQLRAGQTWATLYAESEERLATGVARVEGAIGLAAAPVALPPLVYGMVYPDGTEARGA